MYDTGYDTFAECLVKVKFNKSTKTILTVIWVSFILLALGFGYVSSKYHTIGILLIPIAVLCIFVAYHLTSKLNAEFEYINTNGEIDVDRIINGKKRQTMATFKCSAIERIEKFNPMIHKQDAKKRIYHACTADDNSQVLVIRHPKGGVYTLVMCMDDDFIQSLKKYLPYELKNKL